MARNEDAATPLVNNIGSFVVLDLETSNLPAYNGNKAGITEFSMYGFAAELLQNNEAITPPANVPERPRVLHKMTLMINPRMMVHPEAEKITGLNNYLLEHEHPFDENAGKAVVNFIKHMRQPVCLAAHNGENFDFPLVKKALEKVNLCFPPGTRYVDTLHAFYDIDQEREAFVQTTKCETKTLVSTESAVTVTVTVETDDCVTLVKTAIEKNGKVDWRAANETTPKRPTKLIAQRALSETSTEERTTKMQKQINNNGTFVKETYKSRRELFPNSTTTNGNAISVRNRNRRRPYPPRGVYKLGAIYERRFGSRFENAHRAEADVEALMNLMLHYGKDFLHYAQDHAIPFEEVRKVGASTNL